MALASHRLCSLSFFVAPPNENCDPQTKRPNRLKFPYHLYFAYYVCQIVPGAWNLGPMHGGSGM